MIINKIQEELDRLEAKCRLMQIRAKDFSANISDGWNVPQAVVVSELKALYRELDRIHEAQQKAYLFLSRTYPFGRKFLQVDEMVSGNRPKMQQN